MADVRSTSTPIGEGPSPDRVTQVAALAPDEAASAELWTLVVRPAYPAAESPSDAEGSAVPTGDARRPGVEHAHGTSFRLPDAVLFDALVGLAAAGSVLDVAEAVCAALADLHGVRAAAVLQRQDGAAVVLGSTGYDCDTMGPGARLPLDSGLPAVEAIRTGQVVRQGEGPSWCAVPFGRRTPKPGAILLSLTLPPPSGEDDLVRLQRLATATGAALRRAERLERSTADLELLVSGLRPAPTIDRPDHALRQRPVSGPLGGDVLLDLADRRGGRWLVSADVCGCGLPAATGAAAVRTAVHALAPLADGPAHLLHLLDAALRPESPEGGFITALVVQVTDGRLRAASAGHPPPLLVGDGTARELALEPGAPLALETEALVPAGAEVTVLVDPGTLVVLYSDGLTERRGPGGSELAVQVLLDAAVARAAAGPAAVADAVLHAANAAARGEDDTAVLVCRL